EQARRRRDYGRGSPFACFRNAFAEGPPQSEAGCQTRQTEVSLQSVTISTPAVYRTPPSGGVFLFVDSGREGAHRQTPCYLCFLLFNLSLFASVGNSTRALLRVELQNRSHQAVHIILHGFRI